MWWIFRAKVAYTLRIRDGYNIDKSRSHYNIILLIGTLKGIYIIGTYLLLYVYLNNIMLCSKTLHLQYASHINGIILILRRSYPFSDSEHCYYSRKYRNTYMCVRKSVLISGHLFVNIYYDRYSFLLTIYSYINQ